MIKRKHIQEFEQKGTWPAALPRMLICPPGPFSPKKELESFLEKLDRRPDKDDPDVQRAREGGRASLKMQDGWKDQPAE